MLRIIVLSILISSCNAKSNKIEIASKADTTTTTMESKELKPKGIYAEIDVEMSNMAIQVFYGSDSLAKGELAQDILKNTNRFNPPVLYVFSNVLFYDGLKDDALVWFYVAQLRARIDANICLDSTAAQAVTTLNTQFGPLINEYAFKDLEKLKKSVEQAVAFVRENEELYDRRWINLHGMDAVNASLGKESAEGKSISKPKEEWALIKKKTINDYYNDFVKYALKSK